MRYDIQQDPEIDYSALLSKILKEQRERENDK
jgi:hypothetical protein